jgi:hypothetical protein
VRSSDSKLSRLFKKSQITDALICHPSSYHNYDGLNRESFDIKRSFKPSTIFPLNLGSTNSVVGAFLNFAERNTNYHA